MYKAIGITCVLVSTVVVFVKRSAVDLSTYNFLNQVIEIAGLLKNGCSEGKTYKQVLEETRFVTFNSFNELHFNDKQYSNIIADKVRINRVNKFLTNLGKRHKHDEIEYIQQNILYFENMAREYKEKYEKNKQINLLTGISLGRIISLIIV